MSWLSPSGDDSLISRVWRRFERRAPAVVESTQEIPRNTEISPGRPRGEQANLGVGSYDERVTIR